jgi:glycosyltransferase involved in cell wall biosynthesis
VSARVAMVAHAAYPADPRIRRQAEALRGAGHAVDILALREPDQAAAETIGAIRVLRLPIDRRFIGFAGHLAEYAAFTALAAWTLTREHRHRRYGLVQVATLPDFLVLAAGALKLDGVPLLLDLHEDMPAFFEDRFATPLLWPLGPVTRGVARASAAMADAIITVHEPLRALSVARGVAPAKIHVVMNGADDLLFDPTRYPRRAFMEDGELRLIHHSALQRIYGLEVAIEAVALLADDPDAPPVRLDVFGDGPYRPQIEAAIVRHGMSNHVRLHGRVAMEDLPARIASADVGLVPSLPEPYLHLSLSTKLLEYAAMGLPVIASDLATFRTHFDATAVRFVAGRDARLLADAIRADLADPAGAVTRGDEARRQAARYAWSRQAAEYLRVIDSLLR